MSKTKRQIKAQDKKSIDMKEEKSCAIQLVAARMIKSDYEILQINI